jgi:hypothetical protein
MIHHRLISLERLMYCLQLMNCPQCLKEIVLSGHCIVDENGLPDHEGVLQDDKYDVPQEMAGMND